MEKSFQAIF